MTAVAGPEHHVETEQKVTPLELFFDLVFVFAITQVTALMAADPTWSGLVRGLLVLTAVWWGWAAYAWLTNEVDLCKLGCSGKAFVVGKVGAVRQCRYGDGTVHRSRVEI